MAASSTGRNCSCKSEPNPVSEHSSSDKHTTLTSSDTTAATQQQHSSSSTTALTSSRRTCSHLPCLCRGVPNHLGDQHSSQRQPPLPQLPCRVADCPLGLGLPCRVADYRASRVLLQITPLGPNSQLWLLHCLSSPSTCWFQSRADELTTCYQS